MARILFYAAILAAGAALAWLVAEIFTGVSMADQTLETAREFGRRRLPGYYDCEYGPTIFGLPLRQLAVGAVTTLFGVVMQAVIGGRVPGRR